MSTPEFLARAGLTATPDGNGGWVIDGPTWVRAGVAGVSLFFETPVGRVAAGPERLAEVARLSRAWPTGRLFVAEDHVIAMVSAPCERPDQLGPRIVRTLYDQLLAAVPVLRVWEVPQPPPCEPLPTEVLAAMLSALGLQFDRADAGLVGWMIAQDHRYQVRFEPIDGWVRLYAWPAEPPTTPPDPVLINAVNARATTGTLAMERVELSWTCELLADVVREDPERLKMLLAHADLATRAAVSLGPVRDGLLLPRLLPPSAEPAGPVLPLAQVPGPGVPLVGIVAVDAETLEVLPVVPNHPGTPQAAIAGLAARAVPWRREGPLLVCEGPFAAEQILVPAVLQAAHRELGAETLALAVPRPGWLAAQAWTGPGSAAALREWIAAGPCPHGAEVFLARGARIVDRDVPDGGRTFAVLELVGIDHAGRRILFRHHGAEAAPLNELQMLAGVALERRLTDGQPIDRVEVVFEGPEAPAAAAQRGPGYEALGAVVVR